MTSLAGCSTGGDGDPGSDGGGSGTAGSDGGGSGDGGSDSGGSDDDGSDEAGGDESANTAAESLVKGYYTAVAEGDLEGAAGRLAMTQFEESDRSVEQMANALRERGMSEDGADVTLGEFTELSASEFASFTFRTADGERRQFTEGEVSELLPEASAFGGDEEPVTLVHHTGGFLSDIWVPYQPTEEPADGWGQVIVEVGRYDGDPFVIGDFRTYTDLKVIDD